MASEITVSLSLSAYKSGVMLAAVGRSVPEAQFTMTGTVYAQGTISVGTVEELIPLGEVTGPHWAFFKNLDATNFIRIRSGTGLQPLIKMLAGEPAIAPLDNTATLYAIADTAACRLEYLILQL